MSLRAMVVGCVGLCGWLDASSVGAQDIWAAPEASAGTASEARPTAAVTSVEASPQAAEPSAPADEEPAAHAASPSASAREPLGGTYRERVLAGLRQLVLRDLTGALATLRAAAQLEPASPAAFCHLGDVQIVSQDWIEARAAFESCGRFAALSRDERYTTLALVGAARVAELSHASLAERKDAYARLGAATTSPIAGELAAQRTALLDSLLALEAEYGAVRQRIADRQAQPKPR